MSQITLERVQRVADVCASASRDRGDLTGALSDLAKVESWAAARRAQLVSALAEQPASFPEADIADTTGCTLGAAAKETERANTLGAAESFADALDSGIIRPGHVDALTRTRKQLSEEQAAQLLDQQEQLAEAAATTSIREFEQHLAREAKKLQTEADADADADAEAQLDRQRRTTRLSVWVDQVSGMWNIKGQFDPDTGRKLNRLLDDAVASLFADETPDTAPADPALRTQHLQALALTQLLTGARGGRTRPGNPIAVVDATNATTSPARAALADATKQAGSGLIVDWGLPVELPFSVLRDLFDITDPDVVVIANGLVLHAPGVLDPGRTTRLANRAQRRALAGLYGTCAVPGCTVHYDRCRLHHVVWWRNGGHTDLSNLLPVCQHHHSQLHNGGWLVELGPHRELTITVPNGQVLRTGPPKRSAA